MKLILDPWGDISTGEIGDSGTCEVALPETIERAGWREVKSPLYGVKAWLHSKMQLIALLSLATHGGKLWLHLSVRHKHRIPTHTELMAARRDLLGEDRQAIAVYPPKARWVNVHPYVLHLWCCLEDDGLPHFEDPVTGI